MPLPWQMTPAGIQRREREEKKPPKACGAYVQVHTSLAKEWMMSRARRNNSFWGISISKGKKRTSVWWLRRDGGRWRWVGVEGCKDCMECFWVNCTWTPEKSISTWQNLFPELTLDRREGEGGVREVHFLHCVVCCVKRDKEMFVWTREFSFLSRPSLRSLAT